MNFIAATVELRSHFPDPINVYGLDYCGADAVVPSNNSSGEVKLRLLCFNKTGGKLDSFHEWKQSTKALVTGYLVFNDDTSQPLDLIITTIEPNIPQDMYCNQVVLGNAFFGKDEAKDRKNGVCAIKIGTTLDNSDVTTWLYMELHESRKPKLLERFRSGRPICVHGYIREYRKEGDTSPYRAIVANDFSTRKDLEKSQGSKDQSKGKAKGYAETDPIPEY
tara:strand:- start:539 stop:1201 length:663 start_codon:yes stop_codon:yes gene_type:complete